MWRPIRFCLFFIAFLFACYLPWEVDPSDFAEQDLSGRDYSWLQIYNQDLSGKNLQNADFTGSDIFGTDFTGSDLRGAILESADLDGANFTSADLRGANLDFACQFQDADWTGALLDPKWEKIFALFEKGAPNTKDFRGLDFSSVCFAEIEWDGPDFSDANLEAAKFVSYAGGLAFASFRNADLRSTFLDSAYLGYADFTGASMSNTILSGADLTGALISPEQLAEAILSDCTRLPDGSLVSIGCH